VFPHEPGGSFERVIRTTVVNIAAHKIFDTHRFSPWGHVKPSSDPFDATAVPHGPSYKGAAVTFLPSEQNASAAGSMSPLQALVGLL
jgi:hypothetical protein